MTANAGNVVVTAGNRHLQSTRMLLAGVAGILLQSGIAWSANVEMPTQLVEPIAVDSAQPSTWPDGDWVPLRGRELKDLLEQSRPQPEGPRQSWIDRATYSATFDGRSLRGGWLTADIQHHSKQPKMLSLEPINLAVSELNWVDQPAIWGTLGNGRSALFVDGNGSTLTGRWNLTGRTLPRSVEFDVQIPKATVSRIRLLLPEGFNVTASVGQSRWIKQPGESSLRQWELDLGSRTDCRITIRQRSDRSLVRPLVLTESTHSYVFREDGVQMQAEFLLDVANAPVNLLVFAIPEGIDVYSVNYGSNGSLAWRMIPDGDDQLLALQLSDPLKGSSRPIRIAGTTSLRLGKKWQIPQPRLKSALNSTVQLRNIPNAFFNRKRTARPGNVAFLNGAFHLKFESPLELQLIDSNGFRQTAAVSTPDVSNSLSYQQYDPSADFKLEVDFPKLRRNANLLTFIDTSGENWAGTVQATLSTAAGTIFEAEFLLAPLWEVIEVRSRNDESALANWSVRRRKGGSRQLSVEFRDAISVGSPKQIEVVARRLPLPRNRALRLPILRPLGHRSAEHIVAVLHSAAATPKLDSRSIFHTITRDSVPEFANDSELWQAIEAADTDRIVLLHSTNAVGNDRLRLERSITAIDANMWVQTTLDSSGLHESWQARLKPQGGPVDRVHIYVTVAGGDIQWKQDSPIPVKLTAARVASNRHSDWELPPGGELWEIQLPQSMSREFSIIGTRTRELAVSLMPALATVPGCSTFHGIVELQTAANLSVDIKFDRLKRVAANEINQFHVTGGGGAGLPFPESINRLPSSRLWSYKTPDSSLLLRLLGEVGDSQRSRVAAFKLQSILSDEFPGFDRHRATLTLLDGRSDEDICFELPSPAVLLSTSLNGKLVTPHRSGEEWVVAHGDDSRTATLQIEYQSPSTGGPFFNRQTIPLPQCAYTILEFQWECALPADVWMVREPTGMILLERLPQLSWAERFFGPLGRPVGRTIFNPFVAGSWKLLVSSNSDVKNVNRSDSDASFVPAGWVVIRATAPNVPAGLTISTRRHSQAWLLAWVCTLGCMLFGLLMRIREWSFRKSVFGYWLSICLFAAWLSPPFYALLAGGCVAGTIVALLFPRRLLESLRFQKQPDDVVPLGSTASFRHFPAITLLLFSLLIAARSFGQDGAEPIAPSTDNKSETQPPMTPIRVLVSNATGESDFANDDVVHVERKALARLKMRVHQRNEALTYLVSAANYSATIDDQQSAIIEAKYKVYLLPNVNRTRIAFPNTGANPSNCFVNGKPQPIVLSDDGREFSIELSTASDETAPDGLTEFNVRLELRPATENEGPGPGSGYRLNTIAVASARLTQEFWQPLQTIEVIGARGERAIAADRRSLSVLLGKTGQFQVLWSQNAEPVKAQTQVEAAVTTNVTMHPTWLELRYHVDYRVLAGQIDFVTWNLPHAVDRMVIREVMLDGLPVKNLSTASTGEKTSKLLVEFTASQRQEFTVDALIVVPVIVRDLAIPVPTASLIDNSAQQYQVVQSQNLIGIAVQPEFELTPPAVTKLGKNLREIAATTYRDAAGDESSFRPIRFAYEVQHPGQALLFKLSPAVPVRKVRMIQTGIVGRDVLQWSLTADLETSRAPVFRHRLRVPPELEITHISVREDEAERLVHWSRRGNLVEIFLSDKSTGIQSLLLTGELRLPRLTAVPLPLIAFDQAETIDSRLRLFREDGIDLQLLAPDTLGRIETAIAPVANNTDVKFVGQFRILPDTDSPRIQISANIDQTAVTAAIGISRHAPGEWQISYRYALRSGSGGQPIDLVRLQVPRQIADRIRVESPAAEISRNSTDDGKVEFNFRPKSKLATSLDVIIIAIVDEPSPGDWQLPRIDVDDVNMSERLLLISPNLGIQPAGPNDTRVLRRDMPIHLRSRANSNRSEIGWDAYKLASQDVTFIVGLAEADPQTSRIPIVETRVVHADDGSAFGQTTIWVANLVEDELELSWPRRLEIRALFVDGQSAATFRRDRESNTLAILIATRPMPHRIDVHWSQPAVVSDSVWSHISQPLPTLRSIAVEHSIVSIVPPEGTFYAASDELKSFDELDHALDKLQALSELQQFQADGVQNMSVWLDLQRQLQHLEKHLATRRTTLKNTSRGAGQLELFDLLNGIIADMQSQFPPADAKPDGLVPFIVASGSTIAVQTPNRWTLSGSLPQSSSLSPLPVSFWSIESGTILALLMLCGLPLVPLVRWLVNLRIGRWLAQHQPAAWMLLGLFWWTCLRQSGVGIVLLIIAVVVAFRDRRRASDESDFVVDVSPDAADGSVTALP